MPCPLPYIRRILQLRAHRSSSECAFLEAGSSAGPGFNEDRSGLPEGGSDLLDQSLQVSYPSLKEDWRRALPCCTFPERL